MLARVRAILGDRVRRHFRMHLESGLTRYSRNIDLEFHRRAVAETADYIAANLWAVPVLPTQEALLGFAVGKASTSGLVLEFGVGAGQTLRMIAALVDGPVHGFDSFDGLPEPWLGPQMDAGTFRVPAAPSGFPGNVSLEVGLFSATLPGFLNRHSGPIRFVHFDADLYSSTTFVLEHIVGRIMPGTVFLFDEYYNYPNWQRDGEFRAFQEFVAAHAVAYEYIGHMRATHRRVAVRITGMPRAVNRS